jgi:hypothetical protein
MISHRSFNIPRAGAGFAILLSIAVAATAADAPIVNSAKDVKWGPAPPMVPKGAMLAVMSGDPASTGPVAVRLKLPAGYAIPAHWHPTDEQITVLSGSISIGMGDVLDKKKGTKLSAGGFGVAPAKMHHYAWTTTGGTIQLNLMGPLEVNYVDPANDPRKAAEH